MSSSLDNLAPVPLIECLRVVINSNTVFADTQVRGWMLWIMYMSACRRIYMVSDQSDSKEIRCTWQPPFSYSPIPSGPAMWLSLNRHPHGDNANYPAQQTSRCIDTSVRCFRVGIMLFQFPPICFNNVPRQMFPGETRLRVIHMKVANAIHTSRSATWISNDIPELALQNFYELFHSSKLICQLWDNNIPKELTVSEIVCLKETNRVRDNSDRNVGLSLQMSWEKTVFCVNKPTQSQL